MRFDVTILGSNSAIPAHGRHPTAQLLNINEKHYLIDCGEGTQIQLNRYRLKKGKINHIFISHLHGDHYFGLIGLITTMNLIGRTNPLDIYAHSALEEIIQMQLDVSNLILRYELNFHAINDHKSEQILKNDEIIVESIPLNHRVPCVGFIFKEVKQDRKYLTEIGEKYNVPVDAISHIKKGQDYTDENGNVIKNEELTQDPPKPRKYAYITDTTYLESIIPKIKDADLLYHEATFVHELHERAKETFHTTTTQAATIAKKANVKKLIIGHFSAKYKTLEPIIDETRETFPNTELAIEGRTFSIPRTD